MALEKIGFASGFIFSYMLFSIILFAIFNSIINYAYAIIIPGILTITGTVIRRVLK